MRPAYPARLPLATVNSAMSRRWRSRAWPEIGAVAAQVACPHRARPEVGTQGSAHDHGAQRVWALCAWLAGRWVHQTHPIHKPGPRSLPRFWSVSHSAATHLGEHNVPLQTE